MSCPPSTGSALRSLPPHAQRVLEALDSVVTRPWPASFDTRFAAASAAAARPQPPAPALDRAAPVDQAGFLLGDIRLG